MNTHESRYREINEILVENFILISSSFSLFFQYFHLNVIQNTHMHIQFIHINIHIRIGNYISKWKASFYQDYHEVRHDSHKLLLHIV